MANAAGKMFMAYLEQKGIKAEFKSEDEHVIRTGFRIDNTQLEVFVFFNEDCTDVHVIGRDFINIPSGKTAEMLMILNTCNDQYRWYKFVGDVEDGEIKGMHVECDDIIQLDSCAEETFELVERLAHIVDDVYPKIMKALWS